MSLPESARKEADALPPALRALLEAEVAAGNEIVEVGHTFPAPPVGAYFKLKNTITTRPQKSGDGIVYYDRNSPSYSGEITDEKRFFFILEPAHPPEPEPDMNAIRAKLEAQENSHRPGGVAPPVKPVFVARVATPDTPLARFEHSLVIDYEQWHDGIGYDIDALRAMSDDDRKYVEKLLIHRGGHDWRDIEALAFLRTPAAEEAIKVAMRRGGLEARNAVLEYAPELVSETERTKLLLAGLKTGEFFGGLSQTLDQVETFHPPEIVEALFRGALDREGEVAVHFAAMLTFIHGKAPEAFDMEQRPFFLRFNTEDSAERETAFRELCANIGVDAAKYVRPKRSSTRKVTRK